MNQPTSLSTRQARDIMPHLLLTALAALIVLPSLRLADSLPVALELLTHFQPQYALACVALAGLFAWRRRRVPMVLALAALLLNGSALMPWYKPLPEAVASPGGVSLRILHANVNAWNDDFESLAELVRRERPDVLALQEFSTPWRDALAGLADMYPHSVGEPDDGPFGIALYSRFPFTTQRVVVLVEGGTPSIDVTVDVHGTAVRMLSTHPFPPMGSEMFGLRNDQLDAIAKELGATTQPTILMGDLNATPWSPYYQDLERATGLQNVRRGFGVIATWPALLGPLGIPIDHVLVSDGVGVVDVRAGADIGSDHLPLVVDLSVGG